MPQPIDWTLVQDFINEGHTPTETWKHFGIRNSTFYQAVDRGDLQYERIVRLTLDEMLVENGNYGHRGLIRDRLIKTRRLAYTCAECPQGPIWNGKPLTLQLDHKNGINTDHRIENLRFLCPNCHTQTDTFGSRNR